MLGQAIVHDFDMFVCAMSEQITYYFFHHSDKTLEKINLKEADLFGFLVSETPFMSTGSVAFKDCREAENVKAWERTAVCSIRKVVFKHLSVQGQ